MVEARVLALAVLLWAVQLLLAASLASRQVGVGHLLGPRDETRSLDGIAGRVKRALDNHGESLVLFTAAVVALALTERPSNVTAVCAWLYLSARIAYVPAYAFGWTPWRTVVWAVGFFATLAIVLVALVG